MKSEIISLETAKKIEELERENKILNNIIDELEKWLKEEIYNLDGDYDAEGRIKGYESILDKLNELLGKLK